MQYAPEFLPFLEDVKALFSSNLNNKQQNHYQCLLLWIKKAVLFDQQLLSNSLTTDLELEMLRLLPLVQQALTDPSVVELDNDDRLNQLNTQINNFYLKLDPLPAKASAAEILDAWQSQHGHGSIPPLLPLPEPVETSETCIVDEYSIFTPDDEIPWTTDDCVNSDNFGQ